MTDMHAWTDERAREMWEDRCFKVSRTILRVATVLIAANAPLEERTLLMEMAKGLSDLRPPLPPLPLSPTVHSVVNQPLYLGGQPMPEEDRVARIAEIEAEFLELCKRNSIALDQPLKEEMKERVRRVLSERKQAMSPLKQVLSQLEEEMEQVSQSAMHTTGVDRNRNLKEWMRLSEQHFEISKTVKRRSTRYNSWARMP